MESRLISPNLARSRLISHNFKMIDLSLYIMNSYSVTTPTKATQTNVHTNYPITIEYLNNRICTNCQIYALKAYILLYMCMYMIKSEQEAV